MSLLLILCLAVVCVFAVNNTQLLSSLLNGMVRHLDMNIASVGLHLDALAHMVFVPALDIAPERILVSEPPHLPAAEP